MPVDGARRAAVFSHERDRQTSPFRGAFTEYRRDRPASSKLADSLLPAEPDGLKTRRRYGFADFSSDDSTAGFGLGSIETRSFPAATSRIRWL